MRPDRLTRKIASAKAQAHITRWCLSGLVGLLLCSSPLLAFAAPFQNTEPLLMSAKPLLKIPSIPPKSLNHLPRQKFELAPWIIVPTGSPISKSVSPTLEPTLDSEEEGVTATVTQVEPSRSQEIPLAAGDSIDLQDGLMGSLMRNGTILSDGSISLPLVGRVALAGMTVAQARQDLTAKYQHYLMEPHLTLRIARLHPVRVYLTGAVAYPGVYISGKNMRPEELKTQLQVGEFNQQFHFYRLYLADAIILAGGLNYNANVRDVIIHRRFPQAHTEHINLLALFEGGSTLLDIPLQDQDVIEVPTLSDNTLVMDSSSQAFSHSNLATAEFKISVIGAVIKPGGYPVRQSDNVLTAIAKAGGFSVNANTSKVFILHATEQGQLTHRELNLQDKQLIGKRPMTEWAALLPNDVIFVDDSTGRKVAHFGRDLFLDRVAVAAMFPFFSRFFSGR
jgi:polysaccharide export outer membrane protein